MKAYPLAQCIFGSLLTVIVPCILTTPAGAEVEQKARDEKAPGGEGEQDPAWFACQLDTECVVVQAGCNREAAVNAQNVDTYRDWLKKSEAEMECPPIVAPVTGRPKPVAACRNGTCALQLPTDPTGLTPGEAMSPTP